MIDPKFDKIPVDAADAFETYDETTMTPDEVAAYRQRRAGLSINDTVATNANTSLGARGVDTSGVESGAGAGAGLTILTPEEEDSAAPQISEGTRTTGSTPRGIGSNYK